MAVMGFREVISGKKASGSYGESTQYTRAFLVRVNNPATSIVHISRSPGIVFGAAHPDQPDCKAMSFDCQPADAAGMFWKLTVNYNRPDPAAPVEPDPATGIPKDVWTLSQSVAMKPAMFEYGNSFTAISNSAGDPLEGLQYEVEDETWQLTKCFADFSDLKTMIEQKSNRLNEASWGGGSAGQWKVNFQSAQKKEIAKVTQGTPQIPPSGQVDQGESEAYDGTESSVSYWESVWQFRKRQGSSPWQLQPWDVGFNQIVDGKRVAILDSDEQPVSQPVALNSNGTAKTAGQSPSALAFDLYGETSFSDFGEPS